MTNYNAIPADLKALPHWVAFNLVRRGEKWTKLPVNCHTGNLASSTAPKTWTTFEKAVDFARRMKLAGIGFVFTADAGYVGIDMDGHVDQELIEWFGSYAERSQSGKGVHIICRGSVPEGRKNDRYEIYGNARYFVMTGDVINDAPIAECQPQIDAFMASEFPRRAPAAEDAQPELQAQPHVPTIGTVDLSDFMGGVCNRALPAAGPQDPVTMAKASAQGAKFSNLWAGHWQMEGYESQSSADAALLSMLRFWTGGHQAESFALFRQSGLMRPKFDRADYRERTWRSIDSGEVFEARRADYVTGKPTKPPAVEVPITQATITEAASPWRRVTIADVEAAVDGTLFGLIMDAMRAPMEPRLPAEVGLVKAAALIGCALSGKRDKPRGEGNLVAHTALGAALARVRIMTAGGQVPNMMVLLIGESGTGKDVAGLLDAAAMSHGWMVGTAGSEEGLADGFISKPNGLLAISEFRNFLDKNHWQSKAASFLTQAFNKGWFAHSMSKRSQGAARETNFCYPNVYANIQPDTIRRVATTEDITTGFLGRFLIAQMPRKYYGTPLNRDMSNELETIQNCLAVFQAFEADIQVERNYSLPLANVFLEADAQPAPTWKRLINEYYPRLALMLSAVPGEPIPTTIPAEAWQRAAVLVWYFFAQAEAALTNISDNPIEAARKELERKLLDLIRSKGEAGITSQKIHANAHRWGDGEARKKALAELVETGRATIRRDTGAGLYVAA